MIADGDLRVDFEQALASAPPGQSAADRLCAACIDLLDVDGAAVSVIYQGATRGTFGSSGELSRRLDEFQFTYGEGPCLDAFSARRPVLVPDLGLATERRWPAYAPAALAEGIRGVFALPVSVGGAPVGVLDLFRHDPGGLSQRSLGGGLVAAGLVAGSLLDLMAADMQWAADGSPVGVGDHDGQLAALDRVEVYQATGMVMEYLGVGPIEALLRLRGHAFAHGLTASEAAWAVVERRLMLHDDSLGAERSGP